jgi:hypothetical protein
MERKPGGSRTIHPALIESKNVENTGETFVALTLTHRSPPTPSFLFSTFLLSTSIVRRYRFYLYIEKRSIFVARDIKYIFWKKCEELKMNLYQLASVGSNSFSIRTRIFITLLIFFMFASGNCSGNTNFFFSADLYRY